MCFVPGLLPLDGIPALRGEGIFAITRMQPGRQPWVSVKSTCPEGPQKLTPRTWTTWITMRNILLA